MAQLLMFIYVLIIFLSLFLVEAGRGGSGCMSFFTPFFNIFYAQYFISF